MPPSKKTTDKDTSTGKKQAAADKNKVYFVHFPKIYKLLECRNPEDASRVLLMFPEEDRVGHELLTFKSYDDANKKIMAVQQQSMDALMKLNATMAKRLNDMETACNDRSSPTKKAKSNEDITPETPPCNSHSKAANETVTIDEVEAVVVTPNKQPPAIMPSSMDNLPTWEDTPNAGGSSNRAFADDDDELLDSVTKKAVSEGMAIHVYWFNKPPSSAKATVIMLDCIDTRKKEVHWCHKPYYWVTVMKQDATLPPHKQRFNKFHHQLRACQQRAQKGGPNTGKVIQVNKRKGDSYSLEYASLYRQVSTGLTSQDIKDMVISNMMCCATNPKIQNVYHRVVDIKSNSQNMVKEVRPLSGDATIANPKAQYWNRLYGALTEDRVFVHEMDHLNDLFLDSEVKMIVQTVCPDVTNTMYKAWDCLDDDIKRFAGPRDNSH